jgi:hypothetical protein
MIKRLLAIFLMNLFSWQASALPPVSFLEQFQDQLAQMMAREGWKIKDIKAAEVLRAQELAHGTPFYLMRIHHEDEVDPESYYFVDADQTPLTDEKIPEPYWIYETRENPQARWGLMYHKKLGVNTFEALLEDGFVLQALDVDLIMTGLDQESFQKLRPLLHQLRRHEKEEWNEEKGSALLRSIQEKATFLRERAGQFDSQDDLYSLHHIGQDTWVLKDEPEGNPLFSFHSKVRPVLLLSHRNHVITFEDGAVRTFNRKGKLIHVACADSLKPN